MERWRQFFKGAGTDICSVIEHAIMVAASDCPTELRAKRDSIAERLYTCGSVRCTKCDSGGPENDFEDQDEEEGYDDKVTCSSDAAKRNIISNFSYDEAEALTEEIEEESRFVAEVYRIKEILRNPDESENQLYESLRRLELMQLSVEILKATEIGKQVSRLRKHSSKEIRSMASLLISSWKNLVDEWVRTAGEIASAAMPGTSSDAVSVEVTDDENGLPSPPLDEGAFLATPNTSIEMSQFFDGMDDDGNPQIGDALEEEENDNNETLYASEVGRDGRHYVNRSSEIRNRNCGKPGTSGGNSEKCEFRSSFRFQREGNCQSSLLKGSIIKNGSCDSSKRTIANSGPRRPLNGTVEHRGHRNNTRELNHSVKNEIQPGSFPPENKLKSSDNASVMEKIEASKKRLQKGYQQAENAKRQRTIQVMDLQDLPKRGPNPLKQFQSKQGSQNRHFINSRRWT